MQLDSFHTGPMGLTCRDVLISFFFFVFGSIKPLSHQFHLMAFLFKYLAISGTLFTFTIH